MNRTTIRRLIDATLGISHEHPDLDKLDPNNTGATEKQPATGTETHAVASEPEKQPSPPAVASSDGAGVE